MSWITPATATIVAALFSALAAIIVGVLNSRSQRMKFSQDMKDRDVEREKSEAVRDAKLELWMRNVDKKLDQHNGYAERFSEIGEAIAEIRTDVKHLYRKGV